MEALRSDFDGNDDGRLDASDAPWRHQWRASDFSIRLDGLKGLTSADFVLSREAIARGRARARRAQAAHWPFPRLAKPVMTAAVRPRRPGTS